LWLHSLKVAQLLRSAACLHTNQSRSYLNHLVSGISKQLRIIKKNVRNPKNVANILVKYELSWLNHDSFQQTQTYVKSEAAITVFELMVMSGVSLETY
jgi:hypothetical protein